jgi:hypothetical protein
MKKILMVAIGGIFSSRSTRAALLPLVALGLGLAFWTATTPVAIAQESPIDGVVVAKPSPDKNGKDKTGKGGGSGAGKCKVCHKGRKTLNISCNAVQAHLNHGDSVGECGVTPTQNP